MQKEEATLRWPDNSREQLLFLKLEGWKGRGRCEQNLRVQRRSLKELVVRSWKGDTSREENTFRSSGTDLGGGGIATTSRWYLEEDVMRLVLGVLKDAGPPAAARVTLVQPGELLLLGWCCRQEHAGKKVSSQPSFSLPLFLLLPIGQIPIGNSWKESDKCSYQCSSCSIPSENRE